MKHGNGNHGKWKRNTRNHANENDSCKRSAMNAIGQDETARNLPFNNWAIYLPHISNDGISSIAKKVKACITYFRDKMSTIPKDDPGRDFVVSTDFSQLSSSASLREYWPEFAYDLESNPDLHLNMINLAFHEAFIDCCSAEKTHLSAASLKDLHVTVRLTNHEPVTYLKNLKASCFGKLVTVRGTVVRVGLVKPIVTEMAFKCFSCNVTQIVRFSDGKYLYPNQCVSRECKSRSFVPERSSSLTKTVDSQMIKIQEVLLNDDRETGRIPRTVECQLLGSLVDACVPGDMTTVTGIVRLNSTEEHVAKASKDKCMFLLYLDANSVKNCREAIEKDNLKSQTTELTLKDLYAIKEIHREADLFKLISGSLCPTIYGHELVKAGLTLGLFGGTDKFADEKSRLQVRSDAHILIVGDPGLGKSQMLQAVANVAPRGVYVCGNNTTTSGLTVTLCKENSNGEYTLEAGALVLADQGTCCIDEFDKMGAQHPALLEAMEQQSISIAKAGIVCNLPARASIIAAANPVGGHYDRSKLISENLKMTNAVLSRFDLIFILIDNPNQELDSVLSEHVLALHSGNIDSSTTAKKDFTPTSSSLDVQPLQQRNEMLKTYKLLSERLKVLKSEKFDPIPAQLLRKYILYARKYVHPKLSGDAVVALRDFYLALRRQYRGPDNTPVTTRQLESLIRLTEARARLELREKATHNDAEDVIEIMKYSIFKVQVNGITSSDLEIVLPTASCKRQKQMMKFVSELTRIADRDSNPTFTVNEMRQVASMLNLHIENFQDFVDCLNSHNFVIKKGARIYKLQTVNYL